jgi:hypothetical protein
MKRWIGPIVLAATLSACGAANQLKPSDDHSLPVAPYGATATPTPKQLMTPSSQARPQLDQGVLTNSQKRDPDPFDLPPPN